MSVADLQELEEIKGLVSRGQQLGVLTFAEISGATWYVIGGTSAASPLWAAYAALINQTRLGNSLTSLGFLAPTIYQVAASSIYGSTFHDIADGSTNLFYRAETGYDLSTGRGFLMR